jgi:ParB family chromosome partitioning protein
MAEESKARLGRGLAALLGDAASDAFSQPPSPDREPRKAPIEQIRPNPRNPRKAFSEEALEELAQSIRERGLIQPIVVRRAPGGGSGYEIIAGERRWRAAQRAGLHEAPIIRIEADDRQALELAIIENVQRADLGPLEEAEGYERLISDFNYSHQDLAGALGKSRSYVTNTIRLLKLPPKSRSLLAQGDLTAGHARAILAASDPDALAEEIVEKGLTVRDAEARAGRSDATGRSSVPKPRDPQIALMERELADALGVQVVLTAKGETGEIRIRFTSLEQFEFIRSRLQTNSFESR